MDIEELKQRYSELPTDELLHIHVSGELTEHARLLMNAELAKRKISNEDITEAKNINDELTEMWKQRSIRLPPGRFFRGLVWTIGFYLILFGILIILEALNR